MYVYISQLEDLTFFFFFKERFNILVLSSLYLNNEPLVNPKKTKMITWSQT